MRDYPFVRTSLEKISVFHLTDLAVIQSFDIKFTLVRSMPVFCPLLIDYFSILFLFLAFIRFLNYLRHIISSLHHFPSQISHIPVLNDFSIILLVAVLCFSFRVSVMKFYFSFSFRFSNYSLGRFTLEVEWLVIIPAIARNFVRNSAIFLGIE